MVVLGGQLYSQIAVNYFPFQSVLSISSDTEKLLWLDLGTEANTFFSNINLEGSAMVNLYRSASVNYYSGLAVNINLFNDIESSTLINGYALKIGTRIKPFKSNRNVQVIFELSPYANKYFDGGLLRTMLGIGYNFNSCEKRD